MMAVSGTNPVSRFYTSLRLKLHWLDWGNAGAPPLILQHGGMDHAHTWDHIARQLCDKYHVVAPDLRGHGESEWSSDGNYAIATHVYDFAELIRVNGWDKVKIIAHSLGGNVSARFAGIFPGVIEKLVLIEGLGYPPGARATLRAQSAGERLRAWIETERGFAARPQKHFASIEAAAARMMEVHPKLVKATANYMTANGLRRNEDGTFSWKYDPYVRTIFPGDLSEPELAQIWAQIDCPVLLIRGAESWETDPLADGRAKNFRNAKAVTIENAGHDVHHHQPENLMTEISAFLDEAAG